MCRWILLGLVILTANGWTIECFDSSEICEQEYLAAVPNLGMDINYFGRRLESDNELLEVGLLVYEKRKPGGSKVVTVDFGNIDRLRTLDHVVRSVHNEVSF